MRTIRIGCGAGFSGDRIEPAIDLARDGRLDYLVFECLAERTIALAQLRRLHDPAAGFDPLLDDRMRGVLALCRGNGTKIITNMGAANPEAAARRTLEIAAELGMTGLRVACITGDDVLDLCRTGTHKIEETGETVAAMRDRVISANAYIGAESIAAALARGADVVITGRVSDPSLFLGPLMHEFGWAPDDWDQLGQGVLVGHMLECAGQVTGGYFADPGKKDIQGLGRLGFPIGEVSEDGVVVITKLENAGGAVTPATCKEQLLYEIHDPARYIQPDVTADFSAVSITSVGQDRVRIAGGRGHKKPPTLKVSVGYREGFIGEGQIGYAGSGAVQRARLGLDIVRERLAIMGVKTSELRFDVLALNSLHGGSAPRTNTDPYEARIRVVGRTESQSDAIRIGNEVEALYTNGPSGGGGVTKSVRENIAIGSTYIDAAAVKPKVTFLGGER